MKKIISIFMVFIMLLGFEACKSGINDLPPGEIKVLVSNLGYGVDWLYESAKAFENATSYKIKIEPIVNSSSIVSQIQAGNHVGDLCMFTDISIWQLWHSNLIQDITDVMESYPEGESVKIKDKLSKEIKDAYMVSDGKYYSTPWMGENLGFVYNKTTLNNLFGVENWELPKTTNELMELCDEIKNKNAYAFVWSGTDPYWQIAYYTWWAQYQSLQSYKNFWQGKYYDKASNEYKFSDNAQCFEQQIGLERAGEVAEKIIKQSNGYSHKYSQNMTFIYAQAAWAGFEYAGEKKPCVFMPNGDWAYNESKDYIEENQQDVGFMKIPVISSIVENLSFYDYREDGNFNQLSLTKQAEYDEILRAIIDYVDEVTTTKPISVRGRAISDSDISRVREARNMLGAKMQAQAFIPAKSQKSDISKQFLKFLATDLASEIFVKNTYGFSPYATNTVYSQAVTLNSFMQDVKNILANSSRVVEYYTDMYFGGMRVYSIKGPEQAYWSGLYTPAQLFDLELAKTKDNWVTYVTNAGLANLLLAENS